MSDAMAPVGVIGVGTMGRGFIRNLRRSGFEVVCYDVSARAMAAVEGEGVHLAASPAEVAGSANVVLTMLPGKTEVLEVVTADSGVLAQANPASILVELSTIEPMVMAEIAAAAEPTGAALLDGGVSASPRLNWHGQGTILVGGPGPVLERARPALESLGSQLLHTGDLGSAKVAKLINNLMGGVSMAAVAEAFRLGMLQGVDPSVLYRGMMASWARCAILERMPPVPELRPPEETDEEFPDFHVDYMEKDLRSAIETAAAAGASHVMARAAHSLFALASEEGYGTEPIWRVMDALPDDASQTEGAEP